MFIRSLWPVTAMTRQRNYGDDVHMVSDDRCSAHVEHTQMKIVCHGRERDRGERSSRVLRTLLRFFVMHCIFVVYAIAPTLLATAKGQNHERNNQAIKQ